MDYFWSMFSSSSSSSPEVGEKTVKSDLTEDDSLDLEVEHKTLSKEQEAALPRLPFTYARNRPVLFISRHAEFPYAAIITDLDLQFMKYLAQSPLNLHINHVPFRTIFEEAVIHTNSGNIEQFISLFETDDECYNGVFFTSLLDFLDELQPGLWRNPDLDEMRRHVKRLEELKTAIVEHFQALYSSAPRLV